MTTQTVMIEAKAPVSAVRRAYDLYSRFYDRLIAPSERKARMRGLDRAAIRPGESVLEVAVGPGPTLPEIVRRVGPDGSVSGVDLSPRMLRAAGRKLRAAGCRDVDLRLADARALPFPDESFDVLFNSYMLDLIPLAELAPVLGEFRRVLKPEGRLALVNMSKQDEHRVTLLERAYRILPAWVTTYLMGGCRPILMRDLVREAGFEDVRREFLPRPLPSEVVVGRKAR